LKLIMFGPGVAALELRMAWRSEPVPLSAVVVTVNVMPLLPLASKTLIQTENSNVRKHGVIVDPNKLIVVVSFLIFEQDF
jgi:hypothetical protein